MPKLQQKLGLTLTKLHHRNSYVINTECKQKKTPNYNECKQSLKAEEKLVNTRNLNSKFLKNIFSAVS